MIDSQPWHACYTRARHEKRVTSRLMAEGREVFLPLLSRRRQWNDRIKLVRFPMFPGYVFVRFGPSDLNEILRTRGVVSAVRTGGRLVPVSDEEIENVRRLATALSECGSQPEPQSLLAEGQQVEVVDGSLRGIRGTIVSLRAQKRVLVQVGLRAIRSGFRIEVPGDALRILDGEQRATEPPRPVSRRERSNAPRFVSSSVVAWILAGASVLLSACATASPPPPAPPSVVGAVQPSDGRVAPAMSAETLRAIPTSHRLSPPEAMDQLYRMGPDDQVTVTVFGAPELSGPVRVSGRGSVSLPLIGELPAAGLTADELADSIASRLTVRYMVDPHVTVQITEMQSHAVSVVGAVEDPGVLQIRGTRSLLEVLAMAGGLAKNAGDSIIVTRGPGARTMTPGSTEADVQRSSSAAISIASLLQGADPGANILVHPGDVVNVRSGGMIYVVGDVTHPGAFPFSPDQPVTVLQAVALGQGLRPTAAKGRAVILRTTRAGQKLEIPVDLGKVLSGTAPDPALETRDVVFVPSSAGKSLVRGVGDALIRMITLRAIF